VLKFWFSAETEYFDRVTCAYEFFKELVRPENFPRGNYPLSSCLYGFSTLQCHLCFYPFADIFVIYFILFILYIFK